MGGSGKGKDAPTTSASSTSNPDVVRDNYIPLFDGQPSSYKEYRKRVALYYKKMSLASKKTEATINLLTSLNGPVWKQVEHLAETAPDDDNGFNIVLQELDRVYQYDSRVEMPKAFERFFYGVNRPYGQTLIQYCSEHREAARELERHNVKLPDPVGGWLLLRRAALTAEQRQLVMSQVDNKKLSVNTVEQALFYLFGQDYRTSRTEPRPTGKGRGHPTYRWGNHRHYSSAYTVEEEDPGYDYYEPDAPDEYPEAQYYEEEAELYEEEEDHDPLETEPYDSTFLADEVKAGRGYYPVVAMVDPAGTQMPIAATPAKGKEQPERILPGAYDADKLDTGPLSAQSLLRHRLDPCVGLQDGGASSMVGGHDFVMEVITEFVSKGLDPETLAFTQVNKSFLFGGDHRSLADWSVHLPVWIGGTKGAFSFLVEGTMPILIGRPLLKALKVKVNYDTDMVSVLGEGWTSVLKGPKGEHLLALDDGLNEDTLQADYDFDYVTDDCVEDFLADGVLHSLGDYLKQTGRAGPVFTMDEIMLEEDEPAINLLDDQAQDIRENANLAPAVECQVPPTLWKSIIFGINRSKNSLDRQLESAYRASDESCAIFWEVYSGSGNLSAAMRQYGFQTRTFDLPEWNFEAASHRRAFFELLEKEMPHIVWLAPPCTKWSPLQNLSKRTQEDLDVLQATRDFEHHTHLLFVRRVFLRMAQLGIAIIGHPQNSKAWSTPALHDLGLEIIIDQCALGAALPHPQGNMTPIKKTTKLVVNQQLLMETLGVYRCDGTHRHQTLMGSASMIGSRARAYYAQFIYGNSTAAEALPASDIDMEEYEPSEGTPDDDDLPSTTLEGAEQMEDQIYDNHRLLPHIPVHNQIHHNQSLLSHIPVYNQIHHNQSLLPHNPVHNLIHHQRTPAEAQRIVARLHRLVVETAENYQCPSCRKLAPPVQVLEKTIPVITMMDAATRYVAARCWIRVFGPPRTLFVDSHRVWGSDEVMQYASEHGMELVISCGEAHERLAQLERRHQVLRRSVELYLEDNPPTGPESLVEALCFIIPQLNQSLSVGGFSPTQWVLGYQPNIPGSLLDSNVNYSHLDPTEAFQHKMQCRVRAATAVVKADNELRLRRTSTAPRRSATDAGPATVVLVESQRGPDHPPTVYWLVHGSALIRAAPEHVRPDLESDTLAADPPVLVRHIQNRGTTVYLDRPKTNKKRRREDLAHSDDEAMDDDDGDSPPPKGPLPRLPQGYAGGPPAGVTPTEAATTPIPHAEGTLRKPLRPGTATGGETSSGNTPNDNMHHTFSPNGPETFEQKRARIDRSETISHVVHPTFRTPTTPETFEQRRSRIDRSETISYGPRGPSAPPRPQPYGPTTEHGFLVDVLELENSDGPEETGLPPGWYADEHGYLALEPIHDTWELKGNTLIRNHYVVRDCLFNPRETGDCPIPEEMLAKDRTTRKGKHCHQDRWRNHPAKNDNHYWTGQTAFKILARHRRDAQQAFYAASKGATTHAGTKEKRQKDARSNLSERAMSLADRVAFVQAKKKELESFFTNQVWECATEQEAPANRVLKAHFILKWSKHPDGSPRAKARLITQGFRDPDALAGLLDSTSPTLSRLGRTTLMSLAAIRSWSTFIADITTAFLQGKEHPASRTLWIRLPADARALLGITDPRVLMRLRKPMYGLSDAPRAWYEEASRRLLSLGFTKHPLDGCLYLLFDTKLRCAIGLHVDDLLGVVEPSWASKTREDLQSLFAFRDFREDQPSFDFLGTQVTRQPDGGLACGHEDYINKVKPIALEKSRQADPDSPATDKEKTQLRALVGALQW
ncbi:RE1, partial [Symbiodinium necroappetens]